MDGPLLDRHNILINELQVLHLKKVFGVDHTVQLVQLNEKSQGSCVIWELLMCGPFRWTIRWAPLSRAEAELGGRQVGWPSDINFKKPLEIIEILMFVFVMVPS